MTGLPQAVIALAIGNRLVTKLQALGRRDGCRRRRLALPGKDVEHDVGAAGAAVERLGAGRLDRLQSVLLNRREGSVAKSGYLVTCLRDLPRGVEA